jgi:GntR family transcriptional regulator/MocR family aminotransferase
LLIGYGCVPEEEIEPAFEKLATVLDPALGLGGWDALDFGMHA